MWGLPGPGIESVSPADRVLTAGPPRESRRTWFQCLLAVSHWFVGQDPACSPLSLKLKNHVHLTLSSVMSPKLLRFRISRIKLMIQTHTCSSGFSDSLSVHSCNPESSNLLFPLCIQFITQSHHHYLSDFSCTHPLLSINHPGT